MFDAHCGKCHAAGGSGGKGKGPDLSHIGGEHDAEWIAEHIRNPKAHKPNSRMPAFDGKLTDEEIKSLSDYLVAMK
jgi:mono/diheme cytochrome c family protein